MFPYYLLIIFPFFIEAVDVILHPAQDNAVVSHKKNISIVVFFVIWLLMLSLRSIECGSDLINYEFFFYKIQNMDFNDVVNFFAVEPFYFIFNWIIAQIYPDFRLVIVLTAFFCVGSVGWFYWKESESAPLTILLFATNACFAMFYSGMRQSLAMLFVVPAYYLTKQKKIIPFVMIVVLASYFHSSALVMLFLYPIFHIPLKSKHFFFVLSLVTVYFFFSSQIFTNILPFLGEKYIDRYGEISETNAFSVFALFLVLFIFSFSVVDERKMSFDIMGLRNVLVLSTLIQCFASVSPIAMRMNYYYILLIPIFISKIINKPKKGYENVAQFFKWSLVIFLTFMFFYKGHMANNILNIFPYIPYWE